MQDVSFLRGFRSLSMSCLISISLSCNEAAICNSGKNTVWCKKLNEMLSTANYAMPMTSRCSKSEERPTKLSLRLICGSRRFRPTIVIP